MLLTNAIPNFEAYRVKVLRLDELNCRKGSYVIEAASDLMSWRLTDDLTPPACVDWLGRLGDLGMSGATMRNRMSHVRSLGKWLVQVGEWPANPLREVQTPKVRASEKGQGARAFSVDEVRRLVAAAKVAERSHRGAMRFGACRSTLYHTLFETGLRYGEAMSLRVSDLDLGSGVLRVVKDKGRRGDRIPIGRGTVAVLSAWITDRGLRGDDPVFLKVSHRTLMRDMQRAGIPRRVGGLGGQWHCFRKGIVTHYLRNGADLKVVQALARHKSAKTTLDHYYQLDDGALRRTVGAGAL